MLLAALIVTSMVAGTSCFGRPCNGTNCPIGLAVIFARDDLDSSAPPDQLEIGIEEQQLDQTFVPLMTCELPLAGTMQMTCTGGDQYQHAVWGERQLQFFDTKLGTFRVTVSAAGTQLAQRVYVPPYRTYTCGCGETTTTSAFMYIDVPSQQQP